MAAPETPNDSAGPLVATVDLEKQFAGTKALKGVSAQFLRGEVHGLLGENGAGKSTLIKILTGVYAPSGGQILLEGRPVEINSPLDAHRLGFGAVYQDAELVHGFTVGENILLGNEPGGAFVSSGAIHEEARRILGEMGIELDVYRLASTLSAAETQLVTLATLFHRRYKLIVLDEPTARLSAHEVDILFGLIDRFRKQGVTLIYISHRLGEIRRICDRITILRGGRVSATLDHSEITEDRVTELMVAKSTEDLRIENDGFSTGDVVLDVENLSAGNLEPLSFRVRAGEVLGITGPVGGGMEQVARALGGITEHEGRIRIDGKPVTISSPYGSLRSGIAIIPEDRRRQALFPNLSLANNIALPMLENLSRLGLVREDRKSRYAEGIIKRLAVHPDLPALPVKFFSGGNQQKAVIGKWMGAKAKVYIFVEPTAGVDVGAIKEIYLTILELAKAGAAVVLVSSAAEEIMTLSETVMVVHDGQLVHHAPKAECSHDQLLTLSLGGRPKLAV